MIPKNVKQIMQKLLDSNFEAYIIGGAVRDQILGIIPNDYDVFTNATGKDILKLFPYGKVLGGDERQAKILTVIVNGVEVSQYRKNGDRTETGNNLAQHQETCDFTINALAMNINETIIDISANVFFSEDMGHKDLQDKILRFVGNAEDRIKEDPLRILRGIRFMCKYKLKTLVNTHKTLINNKEFINLPLERIREEFLKIMQYKTGINTLNRYGLLQFIFPEMYHKNNFKSGGDHHNETPFRHFQNCFKESCKVTDNILLRFAIMLHDIGKGECRSEEPINFKLKQISVNQEDIKILQEHNDGTHIYAEMTMKGHPGGTCDGFDIHFYEHETKGADLVRDIMNRLKFSSDDIKYVTTLIKLHMYSYKDKPGKKSYIKFFAKLEAAGISIEDYVMLIYCDHQGNLKKPRIKFGDFIKNNWLHKKYYEIKFSEEPMTVKDLKVSGHDVMKHKNTDGSPISGKDIGNILNRLFDLVMDGDIKNERAELLYLLKRTLQ